MIRLARNAARLGVRELWHDEFSGRFFLHLSNRTNDTWVEVPTERVPLWKEALSELP